MEDMDQYCRICSRIDNVHKFHLSTLSQISQETIEDMLIYCTQLEIARYDGLPQQVCAECLNSLNAAFFFRKLCNKSDAAFKELRRSATLDLQPPFEPAPTEMIVLLEKPAEELLELMLKQESIEQEKILDSPAEIDETIFVEEPMSNSKTAEASLQGGMRNNRKSVFICKNVSRCRYSTTNRKKMDIHQFKKRHYTFQTKIETNKPEDPLLESSDAEPNLVHTYVCKHDALCMYKSTNKFNFERHQKIKKHYNFETNCGDEQRKVYKCKECAYQHRRQSFFRRHQLKYKHFSYKLQDASTYTCPNCHVQRRSHTHLMKHMLNFCTAIQNQDGSKEQDRAQQPITEIVKTESNVSEFDASNDFSEGEAIDAALEPTFHAMEKPGIKSAAKKYELSQKKKRTSTHKANGPSGSIYICETKILCHYRSSDFKKIKLHQNEMNHPVFDTEESTEKPGNQIFVCRSHTVCKYQTKMKFNFSRHQSHSKHEDFRIVKPNHKQSVYTCNECDFQNNELISMKQHQLESKHALYTRKQIPIFSCPHCGIHRKDYSRLSEHIDQCSRNPETHETVSNEDNVAEYAVEMLEDTVEIAEDAVKITDITDDTLEIPSIDCNSPSFAKSVTELPAANRTACGDNFVRDLDSSTIANFNREKNHLLLRCDFCGYKCCRSKQSNITRHINAKCKARQYVDEAENIFASITPRKVRNSPDEIAALTISSGMQLFSKEYIPEIFVSISASRPPLRLVCSVHEYDWWFVITVGGIRCCGCSMFFKDEESLLEHRLLEHPAVQLSFSKLFRHCQQCYRVLPNQAAFDYHRQLQKSNKLIYCVICNQILISNTAWIVHCEIYHQQLATAANTMMKYLPPVKNLLDDVVEDEQLVSNRLKDDVSVDLIDPSPTKRRRAETRPKAPKTVERYRCPRCSFKCSRLPKLRSHIMKHNSVVGFACRICNVSYKTQQELQRHKSRTHDFKQASEAVF